MRHGCKVEDNVYSPRRCHFDDHGAQLGFGNAFDQVSVQIENLNPLFFALLELKFPGHSLVYLSPIVTSMPAASLFLRALIFFAESVAGIRDRKAAILAR